MSAHRKYEHVFSFELTGKIWISGNDKPVLTSADGMERRLHIAEFPESLREDEVIEELPAMLRCEYPAILAWAIEGCLLWQAEGLAKPGAVREAVASYVDVQDIIQEWLDEHCIVHADERIKQGDLYASYAAHVKSVGQGALGSIRLGPELVKRGFGQAKSNGIRYVTGLRLRTIADSAGGYDEIPGF